METADRRKNERRVLKHDSVAFSGGIKTI